VVANSLHFGGLHGVSPSFGPFGAGTGNLGGEFLSVTLLIVSVAHIDYLSSSKKE
jgi:hypothetical protein